MTQEPSAKQKRVVSAETRAKMSATHTENQRRWREARAEEARAMFIATQAGELALREQIPFAETPAPFVRGSEASQAAAEAVNAGGSAATGRGRILAALVKQGPMTDEQIGAATGLSGDTVRPRRGELHKRGLIRETGDTRKTRSGRDAVVWEAAG